MSQINVNTIAPQSGSLVTFSSNLTATDKTGSFGHLIVAGNITASGTVRADAFESVNGGTAIDFNDSINVTGNLTASGDLSIDDLTTSGNITIGGNISGSSTSTGSFGYVKADTFEGVFSFSDGTAELISGSATSTGSFGSVMQNGKHFPQVNSIGESFGFGTNAGSANIAGNQFQINIAIGSDAGTAMADYGGNVFIGKNAAKLRTRGDDNVVIGTSAGGTSSSDFGDKNVFIGLSTGVAVNSTAADANVFIGNLAGTAATSGGGNVLIGNQAGKTFTSAASNVAIGVYAGTGFGVTPTTTNYGVYIGQFARTSVAGAIHEVVIGSEASGHGSNTITIGSFRHTDMHFASGSATGIRVHNIKEFVGNISGSSTSTGSFGHLVLGNRDTDASFEFGRAHVGFIGYSDIAGFSHVDNDSTANFSLAQSAAGKTIINAKSGQPIAFKINNSDVVQISSAGNLGVGIETATEKLHVVGNGLFTGNLTVDGNITAQNYIVSSSVTSIEYQSLSGSTIFGDTEDDTHEFIGHVMMQSASFGMVNHADRTNSNAANSYLFISQSVASKNGYVWQKAGNPDTNTFPFLLIDASNGQKASIRQDGRFSTPLVYLSNDNSAKLGEIDGDAGDSSAMYINANSRALQLSSEGKKTFKINTDGTTEIGGSGAYGVTNFGDLTVGGNLNLTSSAATLEVAGNISGSSSSTGSFGVLKLASYNSALGGSDNLIFGKGAGVDLTSGDNNILLGTSAGANLTTDSNVVAIGRNAGSTGTTKLTNSVIIGYGALQAGNISQNSVMIGTEAGYSLSSTNTNGTVALGHQSQYRNQTGRYNTGLGYSTLRTNIDGDSNTAVGYASMYNFEAASDGEGDNTAVGTNALNNATTGTHNTAVGSHVARTGTNDLTTGTGNTLIGSYAALSSGSANNQTVIGKGTIGIADNSVTIGNTAVTDVYFSSGSTANLHTGNVSGSSISTGSFGQLQVSQSVLDTNRLTLDKSHETSIGIGGSLTSNPPSVTLDIRNASKLSVPRSFTIENAVYNNRLAWSNNGFVFDQSNDIVFKNNAGAEVIKFDIANDGNINVAGNITGSGNLQIAGNISGSAQSTGSFGKVDALEYGEINMGIGGQVRDLRMAAGSKLIFDINTTGHDTDRSYIDFGRTSIDFYTSNVKKLMIFTGNGIGIPATHGLYLDSGYNTFIAESSADNIRFTAGAVPILDLTTTSISGSSTSTGSFGRVENASGKFRALGTTAEISSAGLTQLHIFQDGLGVNSEAPTLKISNNSQGNNNDITLSAGTGRQLIVNGDVVAQDTFRGDAFDVVNERGTAGTAAFTATGNGGDGGGMFFGGGGAFDVRFSTTEKERLRIDTEGNGGGIQTSGSLQVGSLTAGATSDITATGNISGSSTSTGSFGRTEGTSFRYDFDSAGSFEYNNDAISYRNGGNEKFKVDNSQMTTEVVSTGRVKLGGENKVQLDETGVALVITQNDGGMVETFSLTKEGLLELPRANSMVSGSATSTGSFGKVVGEGSELTNLQRPITTHIANFTASMAYAGHYNIVHGNLTCSIKAHATSSVATGTEYEFFQTSSVGNMLFEIDPGVTVFSKNDNLNIAGQSSGASLKKVDTDIWHLVGDLT